ncbi:uncharacterized protein EV422DRAFT_580838 [Fimicolochytrium jonesii]|uniref:uncharacterized protein n=1 Tax=Fimicolochytrium jonesii TaxID=1396493 RepID=UPI0022FEF193|nr:uncharacterized protein EV422DRAFT_580838 [Fimicolochytrium jonesii]KAI8817259.1 hypothetical protein EV422DRAFT_580838 [Fimicolochytrium jonesii]
MTVSVMERVASIEKQLCDRSLFRKQTAVAAPETVLQLAVHPLSTTADMVAGAAEPGPISSIVPPFPAAPAPIVEMVACDAKASPAPAFGPLLAAPLRPTEETVANAAEPCPVSAVIRAPLVLTKEERFADIFSSCPAWMFYYDGPSTTTVIKSCLSDGEDAHPADTESTEEAVANAAEPCPGSAVIQAPLVLTKEEQFADIFLASWPAWKFSYDGPSTTTAIESCLSDGEDAHPADTEVKSSHANCLESVVDSARPTTTILEPATAPAQAVAPAPEVHVGATVTSATAATSPGLLPGSPSSPASTTRILKLKGVAAVLKKAKKVKKAIAGLFRKTRVVVPPPPVYVPFGTVPEKEPVYFGANLEDILKTYGTENDIAETREKIPGFFRDLVQGIKTPVRVKDTTDEFVSPLEFDGFLREGVAKSSVDFVKAALERGEPLPYSSSPVTNDTVNAPVLGAVLKAFLREMEEPLLTREGYDRWMAIANDPDCSDNEAKLSKIKDLLSELPTAHYVIAQEVFALLSMIENHHKKNRMTATNLATVVGPNILRNGGIPIPGDMKGMVAIIAFCIENAKELFN